MDPDANLKEQREIVARVNRTIDRYGESMDVAEDGSSPDIDAIEELARLAELVEVLDGWLRNGGALPLAWRVNAAREVRRG